MKQHLITGAVGVLALVPAAVPAHAAAPAPKTGVAMKMDRGKMVSFKGSTLRAKVGGKNVKYTVVKATQCGSSRGNRGVTIRCTQLGRKQYVRKTVRVGWYADSKGRRVAAIVAVILSK